VGFDEVLQQTPLAVTAAPPSDVTFPPLVAVVPVIFVTGVVVTVGMPEFGSFKHRTVVLVDFRTEPRATVVLSKCIPYFQALSDEVSVAEGTLV
jgi:hypothetical protein